MLDCEASGFQADEGQAGRQVSDGCYNREDSVPNGQEGVLVFPDAS